MRDYSDWTRILKDERLPAAIVDLDAFDRNVAQLSAVLKQANQKSARPKTLRLATKSIRVPELISRALQADPAFQGLMVYSAEEATFLAEEGFDDFLLAYPTLQPSDLRALRSLVDRGKTIAAVVDHVEAVRALADAMKDAARPCGVVIEMDLSLRLFQGALHLGVRRSPIRDVAALRRLMEEIGGFPNLDLRGVMGYEAQVAGLGDRNPFKRLLNPIAGWIRRISSARISIQRQAVVELFTQMQKPLRLFNGGGTGSFNFAAEESSLTELSAGSALFSPHLFDYYSNIRFEPAAFFALQAVRSSDPGYVTCQGGGYIASGEPGWDRVPRPWLPEGLSLISTEGCGEVQTPLKTAPGFPIAPGAPVLFRHAKAGELAEHFNEFLLVSQDRIVSRARTYRGRGLCFF